VAFSVLANGQTAELVLPWQRKAHTTARFKPLQDNNSLYMLLFYKDVTTHFAVALSHQLRALTKHKIWHSRLCHTNADKIAYLSKRCKGINKPIAEHDLVCHQCHKGKAKRQNLTPHQSQATDVNGRTHELHMGEEHVTYASKHCMTKPFAASHCGHTGKAFYLCQAIAYLLQGPSTTGKNHHA
jgi:hypothetical protein